MKNIRNTYIQYVYQALLVILVFAQYFNMQRRQKLAEAEQTLQSLESEMQHTYEYYMLANEKFTEISSLRHDMQNQIQTVSWLMHDGGNSEEAQKIMQQMQQRLASTKAVQFCQSPIINAVLTIKLHEISDNNIETDIILHDCDALPFDNYDLCSLFANLFDNASEACKRMDESAERLIRIRSGKRGEQFVLKVQNSCKENPLDKSGKLIGSSKGGAGHGYGTKILEKIAQKYQGDFRLSWENGVMTAVVVLHL